MSDHTHSLPVCGVLWACVALFLLFMYACVVVTELVSKDTVVFMAGAEECLLESARHIARVCVYRLLFCLCVPVLHGGWAAHV